MGYDRIMEPVKTDGNQLELQGNQLASDSEVLRWIAGEVEAITGHGHQLVTMLEDMGKRVDHLDEVAHQLDQKVTMLAAELERFRPFLDRWSALASGNIGWPRAKRKGAPNGG